MSDKALSLTAASDRLIGVQPSSTIRKKSNQAEPIQKLWDKYTDSWYPEIAALIFSTLCAISTAAILAGHSGKEAPKLTLGLTLNAIISILATSSRASVVFAVSNTIGQLKWLWFQPSGDRILLDAERFDGATRGPLGAIKMLLNKTRSSTASMGAVIIILILAYDPFFQQAVRLEPHTVYSDSSAAIFNRARFLTSVAYSDPLVISQIMNLPFYTDSFPWTAECPTGTCTWSSVSTIAWRSKCLADNISMPIPTCDWDITLREAQLHPQTDLYRTCRIDSPYGSWADYPGLHVTYSATHMMPVATQISH